MMKGSGIACVVIVGIVAWAPHALAQSLTAWESVNCARTIRQQADQAAAEAQASGGLHPGWERAVALGKYADGVMSGSDPQGRCPRIGRVPSQSPQFQRLMQTLQRVQAEATRHHTAAITAIATAKRTVEEQEGRRREIQNVEKKAGAHKWEATQRKDRCQANWQSAIALQTQASQKGDQAARQVASEAAQKAKECVDKEIATVKEDDDLLKRALALRADTEKKLAQSKEEQAKAEIMRGKMGGFLQETNSLLDTATKQPDQAAQLLPVADQLQADLKSRLQQLSK